MMLPAGTGTAGNVAGTAGPATFKGGTIKKGEPATKEDQIKWN